MPEFLKPLVIINNIKITNTEPKIAKNGTIYGAKISLEKISDPITIEIAAPKAAPEETPIKPGSANGFLKRPCKQAPDTDKEAPTKPANKTLGILIFFKITLSSSEKFPSK